LKKIILEMEDQKKNYEHKAKESLQKLLEEKLQAEKQLQNAQRALTVADEDLTLWKEHYNALKNNWSQLMDKHSELENKLHVLEDKLKVPSLSLYGDIFQLFILHQLSGYHSQRQSEIRTRLHFLWLLSER
uniref:Uncharacterized protein n=1 Tax=Varanus komodoensis TaxID=61221 RepID=A0A8D2Q110_VARKO